MDYLSPSGDAWKGIRAQRDRKEREMTRNLKALGLALVAGFAMSALAPSSASALTDIAIVDNGEKATVTAISETMCSPQEALQSTAQHQNSPPQLKTGDRHSQSQRHISAQKM